jgi:hypothetical protein
MASSPRKSFAIGHPTHVEGDSMVGGSGLDEVTRRIERKAQGHTPMRIAMVCDGERKRGHFSWRHAGQPQGDARPEPVDPPDRIRHKFDSVCPKTALKNDIVKQASFTFILLPKVGSGSSLTTRAAYSPQAVFRRVSTSARVKRPRSGDRSARFRPTKACRAARATSGR